MNTTTPNSPATLADAPAVTQGTPPCPFCRGATIPVPCVPNPLLPAIPGFRCDNPTCGMCGHHMPLPVVDSGLFANEDAAKEAQPAKAAHTPGPWISERGTGFYRGKIYIASQVNIERRKASGVMDGSDFAISVVGGTESELIANARLIAAAPDLLAALESALKLIRYACPKSVVIEIAGSAIAKAKGAQ